MKTEKFKVFEEINNDKNIPKPLIRLFIYEPTLLIKNIPVFYPINRLKKVTGNTMLT